MRREQFGMRDVQQCLCGLCVSRRGREDGSKREREGIEREAAPSRVDRGVSVSLRYAGNAHALDLWERCGSCRLRSCIRTLR